MTLYRTTTRLARGVERLFFSTIEVHNNIDVFIDNVGDEFIDLAIVDDFILMFQFVLSTCIAFS
jgi:hypothetical protein